MVAKSAKITSCCLCIKLKPGVIIISLMWLIYGIFETGQNSLLLVSSNRKTNVYGYINAFVIPVTVCYGIITIGSAFGLWVMTCANTVKTLSLYTKVAYVIAAAEIAARTLVICMIIIFRSRFIDDCIRSIESTSYRIDYSADACNQGYTFSLAFSIAFAIVTILFTLYFAMIVSSYAYAKREKIEKERGASLTAKNSYEGIDDDDL